MNRAKGPSNRHSPFSAPACASVETVPFESREAVATACNAEVAVAAIDAEI